MEPNYVAKGAGVGLMGLILGVSLVVPLIIVIIVALTEPGEAWPAILTILASELIVIGVVWAILPRRYEVWQDRLTLVFPLWQWNLPFETLAGVERSKWWQPYAFNGVRFASSPGKGVTVTRKDAGLTRPNIVISPDDPDQFVERLTLALRRRI